MTTTTNFEQVFFRGCREDKLALLKLINRIGNPRMDISEEPYGIYQDDRNGKQYCCFKANLADGRTIYLSAKLLKGMKEHNIITRVETT